MITNTTNNDNNSNNTNVREVGYDNFLRYAVLENDHFLDVARQATRARSACHQVLHGGFVIVNTEGLGWRHLGEARIFAKMAAVAKIIYPERQRKAISSISESY